MSDYPPRGLFEGKNIMTPKVLGYHNLGDGRWAELSEGCGITNEPIFGVTVRPDAKDVGQRLSKLFYSRPMAARYIRRLGAHDA